MIVLQQSFWEHWPINLGKHSIRCFPFKFYHFQNFSRGTSINQKTACQYLQLMTVCFDTTFRRKKADQKTSWFQDFLLVLAHLVCKIQGHRTSLQPISITWQLIKLAAGARPVFPSSAGISRGGLMGGLRLG